MSRLRVMTVLGTRPEIIRLSRVIPLLDEYSEHIVVHTGQNFHDRLDAIFFRELRVRPADVCLGVRGSGFGAQVGQILERIEPVLLEYRPDRVLVLGDTNSGLVAIVARRLGIPVYHMEAGNRCFDDRVPEEVNRRVIDHASSVLMPYTARSRENLLREGFQSDRVYVIGNPIKQVIESFASEINGSHALAGLGLEVRRYFLVTAHRAESVDREDTLHDLVDAMACLHDEYGFPVVCSLHPRTRSKIERFGVNLDRAGLRFLDPLGFFDFIALERSAFCVLSDSGTVQEEACIFGVPTVTLREVTERPETLECGSNYLGGTNPDSIQAGVRFVTSRGAGWTAPREYLEGFVAETVVGLLSGFRQPDAAEREWQSAGRVSDVLAS